jgi:hypothetical protein
VSGLRFAMLAILLPTLLPTFADGVARAQEASGATGTLERTPGTLSGKAANASGAGLPGVAVKLFEEGFLQAETTTAADGAYTLGVNYIPDIDWTVIVWYVAQDPNLIPEIVILRESLRSKELDLWSGCLPRIELRPQMNYDAVLMNEEQKLDQMTKMDCMRGTGQ